MLHGVASQWKKLGLVYVDPTVCQAPPEEFVHASSICTLCGYAPVIHMPAGGRPGETCKCLSFVPLRGPRPHAAPSATSMQVHVSCCNLDRSRSHRRAALVPMVGLDRDLCSRHRVASPVDVVVGSASGVSQLPQIYHSFRAKLICQEGKLM